jgi:hypothetical protein
VQKVLKAAALLLLIENPNTTWSVKDHRPAHYSNDINSREAGVSTPSAETAETAESAESAESSSSVAID